MPTVKKKEWLRLSILASVDKKKHCSGDAIKALLYGAVLFFCLCPIRNKLYHEDFYMCTITKGQKAILLKGGLVRLENGDVYKLSDCHLENGARLVLGVATVRKKKHIAKKQSGVVLLNDMENVSFISHLDPPEVAYIKIKHPPQIVKKEIPSSPFIAIGLVFLLVVKKIAGLNKELKTGSCPIRHQEAITRIAKLEGRLLRKQIIDGGKKVKEHLDSKKKDPEDRS